MPDLQMSDLEFLRWMRNRLVNVYNEDPHTGFVLRTDQLIKRLEEKDAQSNASTELPS